MADPARINELVVAAGFGEPEIEQFELTWGYGDADGHWRLVTELCGAAGGGARRSSTPRSASPCALAVAEKIEPLIAEHGGVPGLCHRRPRLVALCGVEPPRGLGCQRVWAGVGSAGNRGLVLGGRPGQ